MRGLAWRVKRGLAWRVSRVDAVTSARGSVRGSARGLAHWPAGDYARRLGRGIARAGSAMSGPAISLCFGLMGMLWLLPTTGQAQERSYSVLPSPDAWYNRVDGFKVGVRLIGQVPGTFDSGPHRLRTVVWLGTSFPKRPVGYDLTFTEPLKAFSDYGSEASWSVISSIKNGYYRHGFRVEKRWQPGFDETMFRELRLQSSVDKRFDREYTVFEHLWSGEQTWNTELRWIDSGKNRMGRSRVAMRAAAQWLGTPFFKAEADLRQKVQLGGAGHISGRIFGGVITSDHYPEQLYLRSGGPAVNLLESRFTEARGSIPPGWVRDGLVHVSGASVGMGPSVRGAVAQEMQQLRDGDRTGLAQSMLTVTLEYSTINPIQTYVENSGYLAEFLGFETYLFADAGGAFLEVDRGRSDWLASAGAGAQLRLSFPGPDLKTRSLVLRYEIPVWLSDGPGSDHNDFDVRHIVGIGAVIPF